MLTQPRKNPKDLKCKFVNKSLEKIGLLSPYQWKIENPSCAIECDIHFCSWWENSFLTK